MNQENQTEYYHQQSVSQRPPPSLCAPSGVTEHTKKRSPKKCQTVADLSLLMQIDLLLGRTDGFEKRLAQMLMHGIEKGTH